MVPGYRRDDPHDEAQEKGYLPDVCETDRVALSAGIGMGVKTLSLYEFDQSKTKEVMEYSGDRYTKLFGVPGFTYSIRIWYDAIEALKMIGLA